MRYALAGLVALAACQPAASGGKGPHGEEVDAGDGIMPDGGSGAADVRQGLDRPSTDLGSDLGPAEARLAADAPPPGAPVGFIVDRAGALGVGYYSTCLVLASTDVRCWGGTDPRSVAPAGLKAVFVASSHGHNCVILPPGSSERLQCWGDTFFRWATVPKGTYDPVQLAIGDMHSCVLNRDGSVFCWGEPKTLMTPPAGLRARFIASSGLFTCAIALDDSVVCWGFKNAEPPTGLKAVHIAVGSNGNYYGFDATTPNPLTSADRHACAVKPDNSVVCWGDNVNADNDVPVGLKAKEVAVGTYHSCALQLDGLVRCWGIINNNDVRMPAGLRAKHIRASHKAVCAIKDDDTVACWGYDRNGKVTGPTGSKAYLPP